MMLKITFGELFGWKEQSRMAKAKPVSLVSMSANNDLYCTDNTEAAIMKTFNTDNWQGLRLFKVSKIK